MARKPAPPPPKKRSTILHMGRSGRTTSKEWQERYYDRMLRASCAFYATEILRGPEEYDHKFLIGPHHVEWSDSLQHSRRILALASRDHGKSHFWCFAYPLWMVDRMAPGRVGYIFSSTKSLAEEHLDKIRLEIIGGGEGGDEPNPKLAHLLPFKIDSRSKIRFANNSEIRARGFGTRVRGGHPWWVVNDDVGNDEWIWSETVRLKDNEYFSSAIRPMVVPGGQMVVVGTPFHATDLYYELAETGVYKVLRHPAIQADGTPLWADRYSLEALARTKKEMGNALRFAREYLVQPITDEASLFPSYLFEAPGIKQPYALGIGIEYWRNLGMGCYMGVDLAMSASAGADFLVCFVMAVDRFGNRYVVDIVRRKGLGFQEQLSLISQLAKRYGCGLVFCEANQYQRVVTEEIIRTTDVPIKAFYTQGKRRKANTTERRGMKQVYSASKNALDQGVPALRMLLENGKLKVPWAPESREIVAHWISEMQAFGWAKGKLQGVGAHDDTVMAMWICDHACQVGGSFSLDFNNTGPVLDGGPDAQQAEDEIDFFGTRAEGEGAADPAGWFSS